ncbi:MAG: hypothetical protein RL296_845 [Actinomycetota bacterium]
MESDEWIVHDLVLETTQIMIESDDVLFERDSAREGDPALVSLNSRAGDGKPFVQFFRLANKGPHFVGAAVDEVATTDGTHG